MDILTNPSVENLTGGSTNLIPDSLITTITVGFIALNVLGVLFVIAYIIGIVRTWKVQSAILDMRKDVAEIKQTLHTPSSSHVSAQPVQEPTPLQGNETSVDASKPDNS